MRLPLLLWLGAAGVAAGGALAHRPPLAAVQPAALAAAVSVLLAAPLAVALARLRFEGRWLLLAVLVLASATSPTLLAHASTSAPDLSSRVGLGVPLATWVLYLAARALPAHLEDAAALDGASPLRIWGPLLQPASWAAAALVFLYCAFDLARR